MPKHILEVSKHKNRGQSLVEYVALTALVAIVSIGTVKAFGSKVKNRLNQITNTFDRNVQQGLRNQSSPDSDDETDSNPSGTLKLPRGIQLPKGFPTFKN